MVNGKKNAKWFTVKIFPTKMASKSTSGSRLASKSLSCLLSSEVGWTGIDMESSLIITIMII